MSGRFQSRVALISGAGSGIGRAVAERFSSEGGRVALLGRTASKLEEVAADLPVGTTLVLSGSHEDEDFVRRAVRRTLDAFGRIDLCFNNAGTYNPSPVGGCSQEEWNEALRSNLTGPFLVTREVLPPMRERRAGVIINNASTLGLKPIPGAAPYCVSKAGLLMLTRAVALEEARHGIRVNAICPGVVDTEIHRERLGDDPARAASALEEMGNMHPLGRVGTPDEVAALTLFLASDASSWITGAVVTVDGGISLR